MLRFGPETGPVVVVALPLFEEANRTRAFAVTICRALSKRGVASVIPDLPGQGESLVATERLRFADLEKAFAAVAALVPVPHIVSIRSGALIKSNVDRASDWEFASTTSGQGLLSDLQRVRSLGGSGKPSLFDVAMTASSEITVEAAGNRLSAEFLQELLHAVPRRTFPCRMVRLETDKDQANVKYPGTPLWRRAEPDNDPALAALLADDIADWIAKCEG